MIRICIAVVATLGLNGCMGTVGEEDPFMVDLDDPIDGGRVADAGEQVETDAGHSDDAGLTADAGLPSDAGLTDDAGLTTDGGLTTDAGLATDAGLTADAGVRTDGGSSVIDAGTADAGIVLRVDFEGQALGPYTRSATDWPRSLYFIGLTRCAIVADGVTGTRALQVTYPAGIVSPGNGGAQWITPLPQPFGELYLAYRVKFLDPDGPGPQQFEPTHGGKLPGLAGGNVPSGGATMTTDGFSARMMWGTTGLRQYMYYLDKQQPYGDVWPYTLNAQPSGTAFQYQVGVWYHVEHRIVLNAPGVDDGFVQGWIDGRLMLDKRSDADPGLYFRPPGATWGIDRFFFSTFYGGSGPDYETTHDNKIVFDDFVISTRPITH